MSTTTLAPRGRGRPKGSNPASRHIVLPTRVHETEAMLIERAAQKEGVSRTEWMRIALLNAARAA